MLKKSIFLLLLTLIISGCVERGQNLGPSYITKSKVVSSKNTTTTAKPVYVLHLDAKKSEINTTKNTITGTLLLVIGIIVFL
jgi:outer membrane lipoprotein-sorting protein